MSFKSCEVCHKLITAYDARAATYAQASKGLLGLANNDFAPAWRKCEKFREACESVRKDLLEHVSSDHRNSP